MFFVAETLKRAAINHYRLRYLVCNCPVCLEYLQLFINLLTRLVGFEVVTGLLIFYQLSD